MLRRFRPLQEYASSRCTEDPFTVSGMLLSRGFRGSQGPAVGLGYIGFRVQGLGFKGAVQDMERRKIQAVAGSEARVVDLRSEAKLRSRG